MLYECSLKKHLLYMLRTGIAFDPGNKNHELQHFIYLFKSIVH